MFVTSYGQEHHFAARRDPGEVPTHRSHRVEGSRKSCSHMAIGPRPSSITGWDPDLVHVCAYCSPGRVEQLQGTVYESDTYCAGCKRSCTGVTTGVAVVGTVTVQMRLCPDCRAMSVSSPHMDGESAVGGL